MEKYNSKTKIYPDGQERHVFCNKSVFSEPVKEKRIKKLAQKLKPKPFKRYRRYWLRLDITCGNKGYRVSKIRHISKPRGEPSELSKEHALQRAHDKLFDLVYCNDFKWFLSITFNPKEVDSYDVKLVMKKVNNWLQNLVARKGLKYVLVPEYHKSGRIHCHLLCNDGVFHLVDSGKLTSCTDGRMRSVYNVKDWKYGFSTAIETYGDLCACACYLTKYITKQSNMIFGRYYWSSRNLVREPETVLHDTVYQDLDMPEFSVPKTGLKLKYLNEMRIEK